MKTRPDGMPLCATYRVQFHAAFGFEQGCALADYLAALGISHLYASPYLQAAPGSMHGYDVTHHASLSAEVGGETRHLTMCESLRQHGIAQVLDIVPNHMNAGPTNAWWQDVLRHGRCSPHAAAFDIDWRAPEAKLHDKVLLPVLGDHFGAVIERGEIRLTRSAPPAPVEFTLRYFDHVFPVSAESMAEPLRRAAARTRSDLLAFLADACQRLSDTRDPKEQRDGRDPRDSRENRHRCRDGRVLLQQIAALYADPALARALDDAIAAINRDPDALEAVLRRQHYRLACWRTAARELNYRRFFDVNTLIGLRVEDEKVFQETHQLILQWLRAGHLQGLRIDHPDGLRDPQGYLERLRAAAPRDTWIVVEKILEPGETLPDAWPVHGTTGYDFMNQVLGLFIDTANEGRMDEAYCRLTGIYTDYHAVLRETKRHVLIHSFGGELNRLTAILIDIAEHRRLYRDFTRHDLHDALKALIVAFPVYRTYVRPELGHVSSADKDVIRRAVALAAEHQPDVPTALLEMLRDLLLLKLRGVHEDEFVLRFQQLTGPVMAKGAEDTAFYRYHRLICLNEVGGDPARFGVGVEAFHQFCRHLQQHWPLTMLSTSTHDTKRSEDVRARLALISEDPTLFAAAVAEWMGRNQRHRTGPMPDRNTEYLLYQTLIGAWPVSIDRVQAYMLKAVREGKQHTSWTDPAADFESALASFIDAVMNDSEFITALEVFVQPLIEPGRINSLAQTAIKLTAPGVPDIYQGCDLWDLSLVDPDNRRPVDYELRKNLLAALPRMRLEQVMLQTEVGLPKLLLTQRVLELRRRRAHAFGDAATYEPLAARGEKVAHVIAFARTGEVATVCPRLAWSLRGDWADTQVQLPAGRWINAITGMRHDGGYIPVAGVLEEFPVAVLEREDH